MNQSIANPMIANIGGSMMQGMQYGAQVQDMRRQNALRSVLQEVGPAIAAGDTNALARVYEVAPDVALELQRDMEVRQRESVEFDRDGQRFELQLKKFELELEQFGKTASAEEKKAVAENTARIALTLRNTPPEQLPQVAADAGFPDLNTPQKVEMAINAVLPIVDLWKAAAGPTETDYRNVTGASLNLDPEQAALFDRLPPEQRAKAADEIAKGAFGPKSGMRLVIGEDGRTVFEQGNISSEIGTAATNTIQGKQINAQETLSRLSAVAASFKPEYLEIGTRLGASWANLKDKVGTASEADQQTIAGFVEFKTNALHNLNRVLNELSGAAISPAEATRLRGELPDPGEGIWDGDGPTEFKTKMDTQAANARHAVLRYQMWQAQGAIGNPWDMMELKDVPAQISSAIRDATSIAEGEGFTGQAQKDRAKAILKQKYGLGG